MPESTDLEAEEHAALPSFTAGVGLPEGFAFEMRALRQGVALTLLDLTLPDYDPLVVDFLSGQLVHRLKTGLGKSQSMSKALGMKAYRAGQGPRVLDATAGMGTDSFVMAAMGCEVRAVERSPVIFALLQDGLNRFKSASRVDSPDRAAASISSIIDLEALAARLSFENAVSHEVLRELADGDPGARPQVVYLDPMYPEEGRSKSALPKKEMQIFRRLLGDDTDTDALFDLAMRAASERVVVKRPSYAPVMGKRATHSFESKTARFDMYLA